MQRRAISIALTSLLVLLTACASGEKGVDTDNPQATASGSPQPAEVHGNLAQVMRGILYPSSNVIFAAQGTDPAKIKPAAEPSTATDPLASVYGGWAAVENAGLALAESANLLMVPGRTCQNGKPVPMQNPDWAGFVKDLRDAGTAAYKAAQSKNNDNILAAAETMTTACMKCHDKYREKPNDADRCV